MQPWLLIIFISLFLQLLSRFRIVFWYDTESQVWLTRLLHHNVIRLAPRFLYDFFLLVEPLLGWFHIERRFDLLLCTDVPNRNLMHIVFFNLVIFLAASLQLIKTLCVELDLIAFAI